jgi:AraC-like DNA-binding protein
MLKKEFSDFDAFADSIADVDSKMLLRDPTNRIWRISAVELDGVDVQVGELGSGNIAQGELHPDGYMCYLPLTDNVEYTANGRALPKNSFAVLEPGCEFVISTKVAHSWCVAFVPTGLLDAMSDQFDGSAGSCWVTMPNESSARRFREVILQVMMLAENCPEFESSPAANQAAEELGRVALDATQDASRPPVRRGGRPTIDREVIIQRTMRYLQQNVGQVIGVRDLADASDVSERTLRSAFTEYFKASPAQYLKLRQLHQVRRALLAAYPGETSVSKVLVDQGVWAFGRFAAHYRMLFGELPSQTLRTP